MACDIYLQKFAWVCVARACRSQGKQSSTDRPAKKHKSRIWGECEVLRSPRKCIRKIKTLAQTWPMKTQMKDERKGDEQKQPTNQPIQQTKQNKQTNNNKRGGGGGECLIF